MVKQSQRTNCISICGHAARSISKCLVNQHTCCGLGGHSLRQRRLITLGFFEVFLLAHVSTHDATSRRSPPQNFEGGRKSICAKRRGPTRTILKRSSVAFPPQAGTVYSQKLASTIEPQLLTWV